MIKVLRIDYVLTLAAAGLLAAAFELGWLPSGFVEATPETLYTANLFLYYALLSPDNTAMYCLLITLAAHCFCWPAAQAPSDK